MTDPTNDPRPELDRGSAPSDDVSSTGNGFTPLTEAQEIGVRFAAQMMGGEVSFGPPPPDSMLAWLLSHRGSTSEEVAVERRSRGQVW